ncbi:hypothetical protein ACS5PK_02975 [Roseateles sp. DB2]
MLACLTALAGLPAVGQVDVHIIRSPGTVRAVAILVYDLPGDEWMRTSSLEDPGIYGSVRDTLLSNGFAIVFARPFGFRCASHCAAEQASNCFDAEVTQGLRPADWLSLLQEQVRTAQTLAPNAPLVFVTFSGATRPLSRWLGTQSADQLGKVSWIGLSPLLTSPREAWRRQKQGALLEEARAIVGAGSGVDCSSGAAVQLSERLRRFFPDDAAGWTTSLCQGGGLPALESVPSERFDRELAQTQAASGPIQVQAPEGALMLDARYLADVFAGTDAPVRQLLRLKGRAALVYGVHDIALSPRHQLSAWADSKDGSITVLKDVGHSFGADGFASRPGAAFLSALEWALGELGVSYPAER